MNRKHLKIVSVVALVTLLLLSSCSNMQQMIQGTPTFTPTITVTPSPTYTPTSTLTPTPTSTSTPTPNATATEYTKRSDLMFEDIQKYVELGYLSDSSGKYYDFPDFEESFAHINWYQWWSLSFSATDFVFSAHFKWETSSVSPYVSGCGLKVGPDNAPIPQVFVLHRSKVLVISNGGYEVNPRKGSGHVDIQSPYEADFTLIANGSENVANVLVDGEFVGKYKLISSRSSLGYLIFSGTNSGYGTRCKISNARVWKSR